MLTADRPYTVLVYYPIVDYWGVWKSIGSSGGRVTTLVQSVGRLVSILLSFAVAP